VGWRYYIEWGILPRRNVPSVTPQVVAAGGEVHQAVDAVTKVDWQLESDPEVSQVGLELFRGLKHDAVHAELCGGLGVGWHVIHIDGFVGADFAGMQGFFVDDGIGLAGAYAAGVDAHGERFKEAVSFFQMRDMQGVGIGEQRQPILFSELREKSILVDGGGIEGAVPDFDELLKTELASEPPGDVEVPVPRRHAPLLPIVPAGIFFERGPDFFRGERDAVGEAGHGAGDVDANENAANVEDDGAEFGRGHNFRGTPRRF